MENEYAAFLFALPPEHYRQRDKKSATGRLPWRKIKEVKMKKVCYG